MKTDDMHDCQLDFNACFVSCGKEEVVNTPDVEHPKEATCTMVDRLLMSPQKSHHYLQRPFPSPLLQYSMPADFFEPISWITTTSVLIILVILSEN